MRYKYLGQDALPQADDNQLVQQPLQQQFGILVVCVADPG